ncbi:MAG TPA: hypothetical protein VFL17_03565 [Anaerolineae bacterium]|nr:hypothetical protein [Anaerolineae bacterium]
MSDPITRSAERLRSARSILAELRLMERWAVYGTPILVGAVAYELVVAPDIDIEVYCDGPRIEDGFEIVRDCALLPGVKKARFANELHGPDQGLYWQLRYLHDDGQVWKFDMWSLRRDHPGPVARDLRHIASFCCSRSARASATRSPGYTPRSRLASRICPRRPRACFHC